MRKQLAGSLLALALLPAAAFPQAGRQAEPPKTGTATELEMEIGSIPQPNTIYVSRKPRFQIEWEGDYGRLVTIGTLEQSPEALLPLTDGAGRTRQGQWTDLFRLTRITQASAGLPIGSFYVELLSQPGEGFKAPASSSYGSGSSGGTSAGDSSRGGGGWRLLKLPAGSLTLSGPLYGTLRVPLDRIRSVEALPLEGDTTGSIPGEMTLEPVPGVRVRVPLAELVTFRRDIGRGTAVVTTADGESFSGKLTSIPSTGIKLSGIRGDVTVSLADVVYWVRVRSSGAGF